MTTTAPETLAHQDADLLQRLHSVLGEHPAGPSFQLLFAPEGLNIGADEILVQRLDPARNVNPRRGRAQGTGCGGEDEPSPRRACAVHIGTVRCRSHRSAHD
ncbi:hypothetical protein STRTUCAR8_01652 [Streptomyces turgidiscabies Car8]|uniref:Uncharacterized protein n=1 Tax=Streptomyces turgidiscabies (strain Car8) TaxID=698760 RepID=L7F2N3_STRT8|nr:hypothetical protein STRTUCAR8_01652 [Streptomyces turgidiscabies Car8]